MVSTFLHDLSLHVYYDTMEIINKNPPCDLPTVLTMEKYILDHIPYVYIALKYPYYYLIKIILHAVVGVILIISNSSIKKS